MKSSEVMRAIAKQVASVDRYDVYLCLHIAKETEDITQERRLHDAVDKAIKQHVTFRVYMRHGLGIESTYVQHENNTGKQRFINFMRSKLAERIADEFEAKGD